VHAACIPGLVYPPQLDWPCGLAVSKDGEIVVAETGNIRIQIFSSTGQPFMKFGFYGTGDGQLGSPFSVAIHQTEALLSQILVSADPNL